MHQRQFPIPAACGSQKEKGSKTVITPTGVGWERVLLSDRKGVRISYILFALHQSSHIPGFPFL